MSSEEAGGGEARLLRRVEEGLESLDVVELRRFLRDPFMSERVIRAILADESAVSLREVRRLLAAHPATPPSEAQRMIATLYWVDLLELGRDMRARPPIRRAANQTLLERYDALAVGGRVAIARRAGTGLLARVGHDPEPRVIQAMLENPRLTEGTLVPLLASSRTPPVVLALVAHSERWVARYQVRRMICRNRRTPVEVALSLLPPLRKVDLATIANDPSIPSAVRQRAELLRGRDDDSRSPPGD